MMMNEDKAKKGKVWLVGAGPGDPGLMTQKGRKVLEEADVVVYDALIGSGILSMMPAGAEKIYAGKRSGHHFLKQDETNKILLEKALEGHKVVRLKGGDPFIFGRGGEELELLEENGIPYEIVPGVTSAFAVPAYAGIPVTHRDFCSSVHIITGHRRKDHTHDIDFKALKETGGTLIFLMGIASLPVITAGLLDAGMDPDTPAAVIEKGTTSSQRTISSTLAGLEAAAAEAEVVTPAIIVVGKVVSLADQFSWRQMLPLSGIKAIVTRPKELSSGLAAMLRDKGAEVLELPAIEIAPIQDNEELTRAIKELADYDWLVFTSPSGVRIFMEELLKDKDIRSLAGCRIAAIGKGSAKELLKYGLRADMIPTVYDGRTLGAELAKLLNDGDRILIPRAKIGNHEIIEKLSKVSGITIDDIPTYDTLYTSQEWFNADEAFDDPRVYALFTSASTVRGFVNAYPDMDHSKVRAVCIGKQTKAEADLHGMNTYVSDKATLESLVSKLEEVINK